MIPWCDVNLATHDRPNSRAPGRFDERKGVEDIAVVSDRHRLHAHLLDLIDQVGNLDRRIKQGIVGMKVKVGKRSGALTRTHG